MPVPANSIVRPHLQPRARPVKQAASRTHASSLPVNLSNRFDSTTARMTSNTNSCTLQAGDGANGQAPCTIRSSRGGAPLRTTMRPEVTVHPRMPPTPQAGSAINHLTTSSESVKYNMEFTIKQTLCRLATLVKASATAAGIAGSIALLFETAFIPALKKLSIAARQRVVVLLVNAMKTIKCLIAKHHPAAIAALAMCLGKLVHAATAAIAPTPVPLEQTALQAESNCGRSTSWWRPFAPRQCA